MARVAAVKTAEQLRVGVLEAEAVTQRRAPGLQIVIVGPGGEKHVACQPPPMPMLDVTPAAEAEPVPADAEAE
jgi:hypothetical protein